MDLKTYSSPCLLTNVPFSFRLSLSASVYISVLVDFRGSCRTRQEHILHTPVLGIPRCRHHRHSSVDFVDRVPGRELPLAPSLQKPHTRDIKVLEIPYEQALVLELVLALKTTIVALFWIEQLCTIDPQKLQAIFIFLSLLTPPTRSFKEKGWNLSFWNIAL